MSLKKQGLLNNSGFTLIELIITIVVAGILGTVVYTLIFAHSKSSVQPLLMLKQNGIIIDAMERVNAHYRSLIEQSNLNLDDFKNDIADVVHSVDPSISVDTKYIVFDATNKETADSSGEHKFLKVVLKKDNITLVNLYTQ